jgi:hypothetical protein
MQSGLLVTLSARSTYNDPPHSVFCEEKVPGYLWIARHNRMSRQVDLDYDHGRDVTEHTAHRPPACASIEHCPQYLVSLRTNSDMVSISCTMRARRNNKTFDRARKEGLGLKMRCYSI